LAADVIIETAPGAVVLVKRRFPPHGWAIPGGFVEEGETVEQAAAREALEETGLVVHELTPFGLFSEPGRDPRHHTATMVYLARAEGIPSGGDDAAEARTFDRSTLPADLAFDHFEILEKYFSRPNAAGAP
jgi:8-oxo-dGTP diphosphatase